jgi:NIPSNAP
MDDANPALTVFELRRYRARPGRRDELVALFEAHFCPAYEAAGATILGSFTLAGDPETWVWIRAFASATARAEALRRFYGGAVWARLGRACNAALAEVSSARVLRAVAPGALAHPPARDAWPGTARPWVATVRSRMPKSALAPDADDPTPLVLASPRSRVQLRRFDTDAEAGAWLQAQPPEPGPSPHWHLHPTACSRLR